MHILLMDLDLLCSKRWLPNLELMQTFQYYHRQGVTTRLASKINEDLNYYDKVYIFKELIYKNPISLNLSRDNVTLVGSGFYKNSYSNIDFCKNEKPNWLVYSIIENEVPNRRKYVNIKNNCLIRLGTNNLIDLDENKKIYVVDKDNNIIIKYKDFFDEHKKNKFSFYSPIILNNIEQFQEIKDYNICDRSIYLNFFPNTIDEDFKKCVLLLNKEDEKLVEHLYKFISILKRNNNSMYFLMPNFKKDDKIKKPELNLIPALSRWNSCKEKISFYDYALKNNIDIDKILCYNFQLRLKIKNKVFDKFGKI